MIYKLILALGTFAFWTVIFISITNTKVNVLRIYAANNATEPWGPNRPCLLALFTTFKETPERLWIQTNTILNWELLYPDVQPILFTINTTSTLSDTARKHRWLVLPVPAINSYGTPFLKDMYHVATESVKCVFYSYANADILFTDTLVETLQMVNETFPKNPSLVIGRRVNIVKNYTDQPPFYKPQEILDFAAKKGKLYRVDAEDYFAIGNIDGFPWKLIKEVVIGRPAYDNYLVGMACKRNVSVVDATYTIRAIHLSGGTKKFAGSNNKDGRYNFRVIGGFPWSAGFTTSMPFYTRRIPDGTVVVKKRKKRC